MTQKQEFLEKLAALAAGHSGRGEGGGSEKFYRPDILTMRAKAGKRR